jgi:outer membrane usher protein
LLLLGAAVPSHAQPATSTLSDGNTRIGPKVELLYLDVRVNGYPLAGIIRAERMAEGRLILPRETWREARLTPAGEVVQMGDGRGGYALEASRGVVYKLNRSKATLDITAPAAAFDSTALSLAQPRSLPTAPSPLGGYLTYDVSADRTAGSATNYGAILEAVGFGAYGALVADVAVRRDGEGQSMIRTDTYWRTDLPGSMDALVVGDTISSGGAWSRPVRYGGVRYARDFTLAPGYITYPTPSISGSAALPSTVDMLVNNQRATTSTVQPGPFDLTQVPLVTGAGQLQLIVRDMLGRETLINQSYYLAPQLLTPGLSEYSYEAGSFREQYGVRSNDYGAAFGAGAYRRGFTDSVTAEAGTEVQRGRAAAGTGITALIDDVVVVGLAAGYSVSDGEHGAHYVANLQRMTPQFGFSLGAERFDEGYSQFGATAAEPKPKDQLDAAGGGSLGHGMTGGLSYIRQTTWEGARLSLVGANLGLALTALTHNAYLSISANKELNAGKSWGAALNLILPLDSRRTLAAGSAQEPGGQAINTVQATQSVPTGPGWGWRYAASDSATQRFQAGVTYNSNYGQVTAEGNQGADANAIRLGASGSLGWMERLAFASRRIEQGSFAIVKVGDIPNIPVSLSNQVAAITNAKGLALVPNLLPYQSNQLTLNPDQLPFDVEIHGVREMVVPYARSGAFVNFPVKRSRNALVVLWQLGGAPVPAGAHVVVTPGDQEFIVARRGEVYLMELAADSRITVRWNDGGCQLPLKLPPLLAGAEAPRIGPLICGVAP